MTHHTWQAHCQLAPDHPPGSREWLTERRKGVGASDISTILGFSRYSSPIDLWEDKTGRRPIDITPPSPQAVWGHRMEPFIREDTAEALGSPISTCGSLVSLRWPWLRYSPDGFFDDGALFEAKTTGTWQAHEWSGGQVADHAELQVQAGMAVTGADYAIVAAVIDRGELQLRTVHRDDDLIDLIVAETERFWEYVTSGTMPPIDGSEATTRALIEAWPVHDDTTVTDTTGEAAQAASDYRAAAAEITAAEARKRAAANKLRALIGAGNRIAGPDGTVLASLKAGRVNEQRLAETHPDLIDTYTTVRHVLDTAALRRDHEDLYRSMQSTSITVPKGA